MQHRRKSTLPPTKGQSRKAPGDPSQRSLDRTSNYDKLEALAVSGFDRPYERFNVRSNQRTSVPTYDESDVRFRCGSRAGSGTAEQRTVANRTRRHLPQPVQPAAVRWNNTRLAFAVSGFSFVAAMRRTVEIAEPVRLSFGESPHCHQRKDKVAKRPFFERPNPTRVVGITIAAK